MLPHQLRSFHALPAHQQFDELQMLFALTMQAAVVFADVVSPKGR